MLAVFYRKQKNYTSKTIEHLKEIISDLEQDSTRLLTLKFQHRHGHLFEETVLLKPIGKDTYVLEFTVDSVPDINQMLDNIAKEDPTMAEFVHQTPLLIRMSNDKNEFYLSNQQIIMVQFLCIVCRGLECFVTGSVLLAN